MNFYFGEKNVTYRHLILNHVVLWPKPNEPTVGLKT